MLLASLSAAAAPGDEAAIRAVLAQQAAAWNRGDIDGFMSGYWNDEGLRFASGDTVTTGWQATLDRYRKRYGDRAAMGRLSFGELAVEPLSEDAALVFGRWSLQRDADRPHGLFTLLLRKTADGWKVTRDHTSAAAP
ncbi:MAG: nuclear transport factor 2 family protein [Nevskia sp.]